MVAVVVAVAVVVGVAVGVAVAIGVGVGVVTDLRDIEGAAQAVDVAAVAIRESNALHVRVVYDGDEWACRCGFDGDDQDGHRADKAATAALSALRAARAEVPCPEPNCIDGGVVIGEDERGKEFWERCTRCHGEGMGNP